MLSGLINKISSVFCKILQKCRKTVNNNKIRRIIMKHSFYDVKAKAKVEAEVVEKVNYGTDERPRYAFKGKTSDGRNLTAFVSKDVFDSCSVK